VRVIVDTNVFVSGLISPAGPPARILDAIIEGTITAVFSTETLAELREVLRRPSLQRYLVRAGVEPEIFLSRLAEIVEIVEPETTAASIRDPKDQPFLALASCTPRADALVTGDRDFTADSYCGVPVIPPALLADML
jgi:hypothetical protein